ncbi:MAG: dipeptidase [Erysipelotrichaceae bacterium]|nr:dipeptidase [Erysipelotrichaceae bacterium]
MKFIDMHSDTIGALMGNNNSLLDNDSMINLNKLKEADYLLQCFAMFVNLKGEEVNNKPYEYCNKMMDRYYEEIDKYSNIIKPVYTYSDIEDNIKNNIISSLLTIEEGGVLEGKMENLIYFYNRGARMLTLTWNYKNEIASPNMNFFEPDSVDQKTPNTKDGLTTFGIEVVKKMNELGMIIDCSHAGDKTFYDVIKYSNKPIVCSHSCSRSICNHVRNMSDDMLLKLKENNGVVGINFCHDFVTPTEELSTIKDVVNHIIHIRDVIGIDYIGLGSDFDGIENTNIELKDATYMPKLVKELENNKFSKLDIDKITHLNVLRVFKDNLSK